MDPKKLVLFTVAITTSAAVATTLGCSVTTSNGNAADSQSDAGNATGGGGGGGDGGSDGASAPPTLPTAIDPQLVGGWSLVGSGISIGTHYYDDGTWLTVLIVRGSIANSDRTMKGTYRAENGRIVYSDVLSQTSDDRGETWSAWAPTSGWEEQYVLGTDEDGEYLMTSEDGITEETSKYRRAPE